MLRKVIKDMLIQIIPSGHLIPSLGDEKKYRYDLQENFKKIPVINAEDKLPSEKNWIENMNKLRELVLKENIKKFLRWDIIRNTMFVGYSNYAYIELKYLKSKYEWKKLWRNAIKESSVGHPIPCIFYPFSSCNLIHHAYHIAKFEEKIKCKVKDVDFIFEFGGGYGSMCRLCYNLGFRGRYLIFDLPQFSILQEYYLKSLGFKIKSLDTFSNLESGIICLSDKKSLEKILSELDQKESKLFIATWSLSETPISVREKILPLVSNFQFFLVGFQNNFGEVNNIDFFANWKSIMNKTTWYSWEISHLLGNSYLVGRNDNHS